MTLDADPAIMENAINMTLQFLRDPNPAYHPLAYKFRFYPSLEEGVRLFKEVRIFFCCGREGKVCGCQGKKMGEFISRVK